MSELQWLNKVKVNCDYNNKMVAYKFCEMLLNEIKNEFWLHSIEQKEKDNPKINETELYINEIYMQKSCGP